MPSRTRTSGTAEGEIVTNNSSTSTADAQPGALAPLHRLAAYSFVLQAVIFVGLAVLIPLNSDLFAPHGEVDMGQLLTELDESPSEFIAIKLLFLGLRTLYGVSLVGMAYLWWHRHRTAAILVVSFILVSIPVINVAQLMGLALVPLAGDYTAALAAGDVAASAAIETTAGSVYVIAEYLDTFVNVVSFVGLLASMFWLSTRIEGLERIKWILPILIVLPFNRYIELEIVNLLAGLLNVVATGAYFFLMGRFMLKTSPSS